MHLPRGGLLIIILLSIFFQSAFPPPPLLYFMTSPQTISKSEGKVTITTKFYRVVFLAHLGALTKSDS